MKYSWAAKLWVLQVVTGVLLTVYIIWHTIDNGMILISVEQYEEMLHFWHRLPDWLYNSMVIGLVTIFIAHMLNGIRIASKPYRDADKSIRHLSMLKHQGTYFWFFQVLSGSIVAIAGGWHLIMQHSGARVETAADSSANVTPITFIIYVIFAGSVLFHSFNGIRSVLIKLGYLGSKSREGILIGGLGLLFALFFITGVSAMYKFLTGT